MLVTRDNFAYVYNTLLTTRDISIDTETTGLSPYGNDQLFAISAATKDEEFYFDYRDSGLSEIPDFFTPIFAQTDKVIHMFNAKFDMAFLHKAGVLNVTTPIIVDVQVIARLLRNDLMSISMASLAPWVGMEKDKGVEEWAKAHNAWEWIVETSDDGSTTKRRNIRYDKIPKEVMRPYAEKDARITFNLGQFILHSLKSKDDSRLRTQPSVLPLIADELAVTKALFQMEQTGVLIDTQYIEDAFNYETKSYREAMRDFEVTTGSKFKNSGKVIGEAFNTHCGDDKSKFKYTATGQFCTTDEVLSTFTSPLANTVKRYRDSYKRAGTYFANYLDLADSSNRIHASFRQAGTVTGRLSCSNPNLQNVTKGKDKEHSFPIRRSFIAPEGFYWGSIDYDAMEYKLLLDYTGEPGLVDKVNAGEDLHQSTADMLGISRTEAKTINFGLLYGSGIQKLAEMLDVSTQDARNLKELYFSKLPKTADFLRRVISEAEIRKSIFNWRGRSYNFPDSRMCYKATNYIIQGGASDVVKKALVEIHKEMLRINCKSKLILQIHDAFEFYMHKDELDLLHKFKKIMEDAYSHKHVKLTASIEISESSWSDTERFSDWLNKKKVSSQQK